MTLEALQALQSHIAALLEARQLESSITYNELCVSVARESALSALRSLRDDPKCAFTQLVDICGADYPERAERFDVVYHLLSPALNQRVRVKVRASETSPVPSVVTLWPAANWFEREAYDLYGIQFEGHPDLRRILTDYGFEGHPLRKDFPLTGYTEVRYDEIQKRIVYEPVSLPQDFRNFDTLSPWEGMVNVQLPGDEKAVDPNKLLKKAGK